MGIIAVFKRTAVAGMVALGVAAPMGAHQVATADEPSAQASPALKIVGFDRDVDGKGVYLRQGIYFSGGTGFGWTKIQQKHNIHNKDVIGFVIKEPGGRYKVARNKYRYDAYAHRAECVGSSCEVVDTRPLVAINDLRKFYGDYHDVPMEGRRPGIVTTFCQNPGRAWKCPDWVDESINARPTERSATRDLTVLSYAQLTQADLDQLAESGRVVGGKVL